MRKIFLSLAISLLVAFPCFAATATVDVEPGERLVVTGTCADGDAAEVIKTGTFYIECIVWEAPTTIGHDLELVTGASELNLLTIQCGVANESQVLYPKTLIRGGLYVDQLDSGSLVIFYHDKRP